MKEDVSIKIWQFIYIYYYILYIIY